MDDWKRSLLHHAAWAMVGVGVSYACGGSICDMMVVAAVVVAGRYIIG